MKKFLAMVAVVAFAVVPAMADDVPDGADCAATDAPGSVTLAALDGGEADRGAFCVSDGDDANGAELYVGGELQAEQDGSPEYGGACGAIIVGGESLAGDPDWNTDTFHCD